MKPVKIPLAGGILINLIDTAGIHESDDKIEQIGIAKSKKAIDEADFLIVLLDGSKDLDKEDAEILAVAIFCDEPSARNSNLFPVKAKGLVLLRSERSLGKDGKADTPISIYGQLFGPSSFPPLARH